MLAHPVTIHQKTQHDSWKFQPRVPLVFAFPTVYLRRISPTPSSAGCQGQAKIPAAGGRGSFAKVPGGFAPGRSHNWSPLGAPCPPHLLLQPFGMLRVAAGSGQLSPMDPGPLLL